MSISNSNSNSKQFMYPDVYHFPPFFTIQPVLATREKQLVLWRELIVQYTTVHKIKTLSIYDQDCPLWNNPKIQRQLSLDAIQVICDYLVEQGFGEWYDGLEQKTLRIFWRPPEQWADDIYAWADANGYLRNNTIVTVYELHSGEEVHGMSFQGLDEDLLRRALAILEQRGQCAVFQGDTSEEDGIKFL